MTAPLITDMPVRLLLVAAPGARALQILGQLSGSGMRLSATAVSHVSTLDQTLRESTLDIVVCDFDSPTVRGLVALQIVRATGLDLPFIFVSGVSDVGAAVAAIKAGADDYLLDNNLAQLARCVHHEVSRARELTQRQWAQRQVHATLTRMQAH